MTSADRKRRIITAIQVKALNPPIRWLAARGLAPTVALLETTGRTSGLPRRTPVSKGLDKATNTFWIIAEHGRRAAYVRNIEAQPRVRLRIGRHWRGGTATVLAGDDPRSARTSPVEAERGGGARDGHRTADDPRRPRPLLRGGPAATARAAAGAASGGSPGAGPAGRGAL